ncbi:hypothetical protein C8Q76DRAFT_595379, partial [Earliella scabrosa]
LELFVCTHDRDVLLFVQMNDVSQLRSPSARADADARIRAAYNVYVHKSKYPTLYAISAFGNLVRFYKGTKHTGIVSPAYVRRAWHRMVPANYLEGAWKVDILSHTGLQKMRRLVKYIAAMCNV